MISSKSGSSIPWGSATPSGVRLLRQIILDGQKSGELKSDVTANEIVKTYALAERALMYDWCISSGEYSLAKYAKGVLPLLFDSMMKM